MDFLLKDSGTIPFGTVVLPQGNYGSFLFSGTAFLRNFGCSPQFDLTNWTSGEHSKGMGDPITIRLTGDYETKLQEQAAAAKTNRHTLARVYLIASLENPGNAGLVEHLHDVREELEFLRSEIHGLNHQIATLSTVLGAALLEFLTASKVVSPERAEVIVADLFETER